MSSHVNCSSGCSAAYKVAKASGAVFSTGLSDSERKSSKISGSHLLLVGSSSNRCCNASDRSSRFNTANFSTRPSSLDLTSNWFVRAWLASRKPLETAVLVRAMIGSSLLTPRMLWTRLSAISLILAACAIPCFSCHIRETQVKLCCRGRCMQCLFVVYCSVEGKQAMVAACFKRVADSTSETSFQGSDEVWRCGSHEATRDASRKSGVYVVWGGGWPTFEYCEILYCTIPPLECFAYRSTRRTHCQQPDDHALSARHPQLLDHHSLTPPPPPPWR